MAYIQYSINGENDGLKSSINIRRVSLYNVMASNVAIMA
jgi:hypothetical protein